MLNANPCQAVKFWIIKHKFSPDLFEYAPKSITSDGWGSRTSSVLGISCAPNGFSKRKKKTLTSDKSSFLICTNNWRDCWKNDTPVNCKSNEWCWWACVANSTFRIQRIPRPAVRARNQSRGAFRCVCEEQLHRRIKRRALIAAPSLPFPCSQKVASATFRINLKAALGLWTLTLMVIFQISCWQLWMDRQRKSFHRHHLSVSPQDQFTTETQRFLSASRYDGFSLRAKPCKILYSSMQCYPLNHL